MKTSNKKNKSYHHIFGPIPSRRLGLSLGIDVIPYKTCTYDCVYCECGKTTNLTTKRQLFIPTKNITDELDHFLKTKPNLDHITFAGSGEPTLALNIGEIITYLKTHYPQYKIAVLTNSSLLTEQAVINDISKADVIIPSLDTVTKTGFNKINAPHPTLSIEKTVKSLINLKQQFQGKLIIEIFIVPGINDTETEINALSRSLKQINPYSIQLNTLDRPGTKDWVLKASKEKIQQIAAQFKPIPVNISLKPVEKSIQSKAVESSGRSAYNRILTTLKRRPCTADDLSKMLGINKANTQNYLETLLAQHLIEEKNKFYINRNEQ